MKKTFKFRIYPTKKQKILLNNQLEICCGLYNHFLIGRIEHYKETGKSLSFYDQCKCLPNLKQEKPELQNIFAASLQNVAVRIDLAFQAFFRRLKTNEKAGFPRFKSNSRYDSITFPQHPFGCQIKDNKLYVNRIGFIKIKQDRKLEGKVKNATIIKSFF